MKVKKQKKLQLSRETLKLLNSPQLQDVVGGLTCRTGGENTSIPDFCDHTSHTC